MPERPLRVPSEVLIATDSPAGFELVRQVAEFATPTLRTAMTLVYLGLAVFPLSVYHVFLGRPLLGMEREGLSSWLQHEHPDAHRLLYEAHTVVDLSLIPLGIAVIPRLIPDPTGIRVRSPRDARPTAREV